MGEAQNVPAGKPAVRLRYSCILFLKGCQNATYRRSQFILCDLALGDWTVFVDCFLSYPCQIVFREMICMYIPGLFSGTVEESDWFWHNFGLRDAVRQYKEFLCTLYLMSQLLTLCLFCFILILFLSFGVHKNWFFPPKPFESRLETWFMMVEDRIERCLYYPKIFEIRVYEDYLGR